MNPFISKDIIVLPESTKDYPSRWVIMNVFSHDCLGVESSVLDLMGKIGTISSDNLYQQYENCLFSVWIIERFSHIDGLMADPTRYIRNVKDWGEDKQIKVFDLFYLLEKNNILITDELVYLNRFNLKKNLLDYNNFGNFHQQIGQHLLLDRRLSPSKWWVEQKFTDDLQFVRQDNLYGAVQMNFLEQYFPNRINDGDTIVDLGCGIGLYSRMMANCGAEVLGVDPNEEYIKLARKNAVNKCRFEVMNIGHPGSLDEIPDEYADYVYMSDALLFYFVSVKQGDSADVQILLSDIRRILKPNGTFISLEPHCVFWLNPWLGTIERPFTLMTEYMNKKYNVTSSISKLIQTFAKGGFSIVWMDELTPDLVFKSINQRAYYFSSEFPVWHLFELKKST